MAMHVGLSYKSKLGGIIGMSGGLFPFSSTENDIPIIAINGQLDFVVPCGIAETSYQRLVGRNKFKFHSIPNLGHSINAQAIELVKKFWLTYATK